MNGRVLVRRSCRFRQLWIWILGRILFEFGYDLTRFKGESKKLKKKKKKVVFEMGQGNGRKWNASY